MKISRIHIEYFRSIKQLGFEPGRYCVLIGENNSGKSNILRALTLALSETWPSERNFSEEDFYNQDTTHDIVIQVYFDKTIEEWRNNFKIEIAGIELRCHAYKKEVKGKPAGTLSVDYNCITKTGKHATYPAEKLEKGQQYKGQWFPFRVTREIRDCLPFIFVDVVREYDRQSPSSRWSILRRLFSEVNTEFLNDKTKLKFTKADGTVVEITPKEAFEGAVKDAYKYLRTNSFKEIERCLAKNAIEQMGLDAEENKVELHFESHDPTNAYKQLQLYVDQMGICSPASEVGAGLQSAIVVAIFRTYEQLKKEGAIFAIEEPEVFLHPQKARYFATVLRSLAENGNQVFLTTHSPVFVQIHDPESVAVVRRPDETGSKIFQVKSLELAESIKNTLRLLTEFDSQRNEVFFARRVMFVEGNTEKIAMPLIFKANGIDINRENVSIIECGGKAQILFFAQIAKAFSIPYVVLADEDIWKAQDDWPEERKQNCKNANATAQKLNAEILKIAGDEVTFFLQPNFDVVSGLPQKTSQKIEHILKLFAPATKANIPKPLSDSVEKLMKI